MATQCDIAVRFHAPPADLARFFTTFYRVEITVAQGARVADALQPEWGNLRFFRGDLPVTRSVSGDEVRGADFVPTGPSTSLLEFTLGNTRIWGIGLLPLGWSTFIGSPADRMANRVFDGRAEPAFAPFVPLADELTGSAERESEEYDRLVAFFRDEAPRHGPEDSRIQAIHAMLLEEDLPDVATLAERTGLNQRTLERISHRAFGFSPKLLLRRQRFMRSLAAFMVRPDARWSGSIDRRYCDQSHFVRDCHAFLGMAPSEYAAMDHPVMASFLRERLRLHGSPVQTLDAPGRD
ncbi:AraC family transcriptional regulator [Altererythrobacter sp. C41]|uniref:AraC family transcriptional regulator n=1 Tax=Altererythrobacter sp. C41 TaxID=2806021 RepID=UPI001933A714|nr:helix-turn-helix domain-containing protein [Altererythrobacter sp. C41]MBM0170659.1 AraC family transcriptional regulator [Altererythrobacter sp. C41]